MPEISMKNMLEAGVHFGHQTRRWNPKMKPYIFGPRNGIYIIDLQKTVVLAEEACNFIRNKVAEGKRVLFVATKKQARDIAKQAAEKCQMPSVTERWLGGTLTNFSTIRKGCDKMDELDKWREDGTFQALTKKEVIMLERKYKKLNASLGGIRKMKTLPGALVIIDPENERIAVKEANRLGIPVVALVDTNCNPDPIHYVVPGNDDAIKSVTLFLNLFADACLEGLELFEQRARHGTELSEAEKEVQAVKDTSSAETEEIKENEPIKQPPAPLIKKQLKNIPTEIDYRESALFEDTLEIELEEKVEEANDTTGSTDKEEKDEE